MLYLGKFTHYLKDGTQRKPVFEEPSLLRSVRLKKNVWQRRICPSLRMRTGSRRALMLLLLDETKKMSDHALTVLIGRSQKRSK